MLLNVLGLSCAILSTLNTLHGKETPKYPSDGHAPVKLSTNTNAQSIHGKIGRQFGSCSLCGISTTLRIIGGESTSPNEFPWMVQLYSNNEFICGGTLIGHNHVLTAAHCLIGKRNSLQVVLGAHFLDSIESSSVIKDVIHILKHPQFDPDQSKANDIAILTLDSPVTYNRQIRPICLPIYDEEFIGKEGTVTGWGRTSLNGELSNRLIKLKIPIVGEQECRDNFYGNILNNKTICAGYKNGRKDSCIGDSGGPLIGSKYGIWHQVGIVSWGASDSCALTYGVYTRTTSFLEWIKDNTKGDHCLSSLTNRY